MKVSVKIKTEAKESRVERAGDALLVFVKSSPIKGKANKEAIKLLAKYYKRDISQIKIASGLKSKNKIIEINS